MPSNIKGKDLRNDPRILKALELIDEAVKDQQKNCHKLHGPNPEFENSYKELLKEFGKLRGANVFYPYIGSGIGSGPFVELMDGSTKYDFITGIGVHYMGHSHPGVIKAEVLGALANTTMSGNLQQNADSVELFDLIVKEAKKYGANLDHLFLTSSGAMACENALKMAFSKKSPAYRVLAFKKCFIGRTMALAQITDKAAYRKGLPQTLHVDYLSFYDESDHEGSIKRVEDELSNYFNRYPTEYAAICMELIQGEGGYFVGNEDFFKAIIKKCKEHNVTIIVDEVQSFARTEKLFAFQYFNLDKEVDIVTFGKNTQVCGTLYNADHKPPPGLISQTFTSSNSAISAAKFIIQTIIEENYLGKDGKINQIHEHFSGNLKKLSEKYPDKLQGPFGIGSMVGMTLFGGDFEKSKKFTIKLFENGVLSFIAGSLPTRVRFLAPVGAVEMYHIDEVCELIEKTLVEIE
ncbi:aminotransferase class III-fold pyridoxal phosphate-dependent enzyme [Bacteriovoracaceae bacterium]|nr:aminotransferase class III-fold pyridoxal phosphate-dependent enzyme [Bacteriovoracaceae bacterium]